MMASSQLLVAVTALILTTLLPGVSAFQGSFAPKLAWRAAGSSVCGQARACPARVGGAAVRHGVRLPAFALQMAGVEDEEEEIDPRTVYMDADENAPEQSMFASFGLIPELCEALAQMGITEPTNIQAQSLPVSLAGESVLLCAETGSGKSLSFLLPAINRMKIDETSRGMGTRPKRPRALILAPTRELGAQLLSVAKALSGTAKFSSMGLLGGSPPGEQMKKLDRGVDLVVATTGRLRDFVKEGHIRLGDVRFIAADEADTMASQGFGEDLKYVFEAVAKASSAAKESYEKVLPLFELQGFADLSEPHPEETIISSSDLRHAVSASLCSVQGYLAHKK